MSVILPPFSQLVDAHWRDVARLSHALTGPDDGDDVAQQTWAQAYAAYPALRSATNLRGWLLTITHRCAMDAHRGRGRRAVPTDDEALARAIGCKSVEPCSAEAAQRASGYQIVHLAVRLQARRRAQPLRRRGLP